jgi:hypothetical protein
VLRQRRRADRQTFSALRSRFGETGGAIRTGADYRLRGGPGTERPEQIDYPRVTIFALTMRAYDIGGDQVSCPEWMGTEQYSVRARLPANTTKGDFQPAGGSLSPDVPSHL